MAINSVELEPTEHIQPARFDLEEAKYFQYLAIASNCKPERLLIWDCGAPCKNATIVPGTTRIIGPGRKWKVKGFVAQLPPNLVKSQRDKARKMCVAVFRGSVHWKNFIADAIFKPKKWPLDDEDSCPGCKVHRGFVKAYNELETQVLAAVNDLGCQQVAVVGHSLGGAMATLASFRFRTHLGIPAEPVYTFGSPRVGNPSFVAAYASAAKATTSWPPQWRVVDYEDIVPRLPLPEEATKYVHVQQEVFYGKDHKHFKICSLGDGPEDPRCAQSRKLAASVEDHGAYLGIHQFDAFNQEKCLPPKPKSAKSQKTRKSAKVLV
jgi:pimeloyl-ACP methyl ester carboxylesterase